MRRYFITSDSDELGSIIVTGYQVIKALKIVNDIDTSEEDLDKYLDSCKGITELKNPTMKDFIKCNNKIAAIAFLCDTKGLSLSESREEVEKEFKKYNSDEDNF